MTAGVLLNFVMVTTAVIVRMSQELYFSASAAITFAVFLLILLAFIFLFGKQTRRKFGVNNESYLAIIGIYLLLIAANYIN